MGGIRTQFEKPADSAALTAIDKYVIEDAWPSEICHPQETLD
jgi:hypothetical protein